MSKLDYALALAGRGFWVFPVVANGKTPAIEEWQKQATRDPDQISRWFSRTDRNIGVYTGKFGDDQALIVVDVDNKSGKQGDTSLLTLELDGYDFPCTFEQATPSGGRHLIYVTQRAHKQGVNVLGAGLDIRSRGGYIVGPGSEIDGKRYAQINGHGTLQLAPQWLCDRLGVAVERDRAAGVVLPGVDANRAVSRAIEYLQSAPVATEGDGGDITTFKVAAKLKDLGCSMDQAIDLMSAHWNDECSPPWSMEDLTAKVRNAYEYGREPVGSAAPEAIFEAAAEADAAEPGKDHPVREVNKEYAFIKRGAFVLQETTDERGKFCIEHLSVNDMHAWFANKTITRGDKKIPLSKAWMEHRDRREYEGVVFRPGEQLDGRWYNLWRGFSVEPKPGDHPALAAFKEHALKNVCNGDVKLCHWLMGFFAHMIQRPQEKPLVALVFKGKKGTGKNALVERVGHLMGQHFMVASDERYLTGNFNSHMESMLFFVLDEAAWAGNKRAEGRLKDLITGQQHTIERKGAEPYRVDNLSRVAIIGNEQWLVPASQDERRFAVFEVGEGRMQDRKFFEDMRKGMEAGGYAHLLHFLQTFDLSTVDVNEAPNTSALTDQKLASLELVPQWWHACLHEGSLAGGDFEGWPAEASVNRMRSAFERWARSNNVRSRLPSGIWFGRELAAFGVTSKRVRATPSDPSTTAYQLTTLEDMREKFSRHLGGEVTWPED